MITSATISYYKSISDLHVSFDKINVIVGPNGVGKSNIIDAITFLHDSVEEDLDTAIVKRHGIESIRQWSKTRPFHIMFDLALSRATAKGSYKLVLSSARGAFRIEEEEGRWEGPLDFVDKNPPTGQVRFFRDKSGSVRIESDTQGLGFGAHKDRPVQINTSDLFLTSLNRSAISMETLYLSRLATELSSFVSYAIYPNTLREPRVVSRQERLLPDGSNLASIIRLINSGFRSNKEALLQALKVLMPSISDILVKSAGGYYVPVVSVSEANGDLHQFNMSQLSDGTLRVLGL